MRVKIAEVAKIDMNRYNTIVIYSYFGPPISNLAQIGGDNLMYKDLVIRKLNPWIGQVVAMRHRDKKPNNLPTWLVVKTKWSGGQCI